MTYANLLCACMLTYVIIPFFHIDSDLVFLSSKKGG